MSLRNVGRFFCLVQKRLGSAGTCDQRRLAAVGAGAFSSCFHLELVLCRNMTEQLMYEISRNDYRYLYIYNFCCAAQEPNNFDHTMKVVFRECNPYHHSGLFFETQIFLFTRSRWFSSQSYKTRYVHTQA